MSFFSPFSPSHFFSRLSSVVIIWAKITVPSGWGRGGGRREEEGYPKRVGVKNLIALISVLAAHPFS